jgi:nucleoside diphosphate kinase
MVKQWVSNVFFLIVRVVVELNYLCIIFISSNICALILEKENVVKDWRFLMGPTNYKKARKSNPNS